MAEPKLIAENLASLNEIVAELVAHVADPEESEFVELVRNTLREHSWSIGMAFQGEMPSAEWQRKQWLNVVENVKRTLPAVAAFQDDATEAPPAFRKATPASGSTLSATEGSGALSTSPRQETGGRRVRKGSKR